MDNEVFYVPDPDGVRNPIQELCNWVDPVQQEIDLSLDEPVLDSTGSHHLLETRKRVVLNFCKWYYNEPVPWLPDMPHLLRELLIREENAKWKALKRQQAKHSEAVSGTTAPTVAIERAPTEATQAVRRSGRRRTPKRLFDEVD